MPSTVRPEYVAFAAQDAEALCRLRAVLDLLKAAKDGPLATT